MLSTSSSSSTSTVFATPLFSTAPSPTKSPPPRVHFQPARAFAACSSSASTYTSDHDSSTTSYLVVPPPPRNASLYEILGIHEAATCHEIKAAYRRLARVCHPDVAEDASGNEFMRIHEAYSTLTDPEKRAEYDQRMFRRRRPLTSDFSGYYTRRRWETDQCW